MILEDFLIQEAAYLILYLKSAYHKGIFYSGQVFATFEHLVVQEKLIIKYTTPIFQTTTDRSKIKQRG